MSSLFRPALAAMMLATAAPTLADDAIPPPIPVYDQTPCANRVVAVRPMCEQKRAALYDLLRARAELATVGDRVRRAGLLAGIDFYEAYDRRVPSVTLPAR